MDGKVLLVAVLFAVISAYEEPSFCHGLNCPKYTVLAKGNGYEKRRYMASKWISIKIPSTSYNKAANEAFIMLYGYISGANSAGAKIPMAVPVATLVQPNSCESEDCMTDYTVSFFIPFDYQKHTPAPTSSHLKMINLRPTIVYVTHFGGFMTNGVLARETKILQKHLDDNNQQYVSPTRYYFAVDYDSPFRITGRYNEIWLEATQ
jgi:hypothetical protein